MLVQPEKIIEFGTGLGGLSVLYKIYSEIKNVKFLTEPFSLHSRISKKRKVPDVVYYNESVNRLVLVEIKGSTSEAEQVVIDYCTNRTYN